MVKTPSFSKKWNSVIWLFLSIFGTFAIYHILQYPSEPGSAILFGFSKIRLLIFTVIFSIYILVLLCTISILFNLPSSKRIYEIIDRLISIRHIPSVFIIVGFTLFLGIISLLILALSQAGNDAVILKTILQRTGFSLIWLNIIVFGFIVLFWINYPNEFRQQFSVLKITIFFIIFTFFYFLTVKIYAYYVWDMRFRQMENYIFMPAIISIVWAWINQKFSRRDWYPRIQNILLSLTILLVVFVIYRHTSQWMDWQNTPSKSYWNQLADAFLQGRLYLIDPSSTHDLTFYQGQWYVPNPPLPAFILMPFVAVLGLENLNMVVFSIWCGAITVLLVFWLLEAASLKGLIPTSRTSNLWISAVFAIGTCFWWLSISGRMWFLSQILTVIFTAFAALLVVKKKSPFLVGIALGLAILSRPNVFTVWPFLLGIYIYLQDISFPKIPWRKAILWSIKSAIPICLAVFGLLFYNYVRFEDFLDFGYVTINGADFIVEAVQKYGMFHPHFFSTNFSTMFLDFPSMEIKNGCFLFTPSTNGYGLFFMTPPLIFIFRRFLKNWWFVGAWLSVLLTVGLLLLYHNSGSAQIGYRYLTDFIVPIIFLLAVGIGKKASWFFKGLTLIGIMGNLFGIIWWFNKWWC